MILAAGISPRAAPLLALVGVALFALAGLWLLVSSAARRGTIVDRGGLELGMRRGPMRRFDARLMRTSRGAALAARLRSAGVERSPGEYVLIRVGLVLLAFVVVKLLLPLLFALAAAVLAGWGSWFYVQRRLDRRKEDFVAQLPEIARLLSNGASAGLSIPAALELAAREIEDPARTELRTVLDELSLGRSLDQSLESLGRRLPSREIAVLLGCIIIQQRAGGDTVHALRELSETLETRRDTTREVRTLMSGAIYTSYVVPFLGLAALLMLNVINSHTLSRMTSNAIGIVALVLGVVIYSIAFVAIRRVTRIDL